MTISFTSTGLTIQTYQEIYDEIVAGYQAIYGSDIDTSANSPDGQRIGIEAKARLDAQQFALNLYNSMDPSLASGEALNKLIKLAGITRRAATQSTVDVTVVVSKDLTLPATGYNVKDTLGQTWKSAGGEALLTGSNTVTLYSTIFGAINAAIGTVTEPVDIIIGVTSVTNPAAATVGIAEETDAELRIRRELSVQSPAASTVGGMYSALGNLSGVTKLKIYENDTSTYDAVKGINANTIWCIVKGDTTANIAETIAKNKTGGAGTQGAVTDVYTEITTDGYTIDHQVYFDRPTDVPMYIHLTATGATAGDATIIKNTLAALSFDIDETVNAANLYSYIDNYVISSLQISDDDITYVDTSLFPGYSGEFSISTANITVTLA